MDCPLEDKSRMVTMATDQPASQVTPSYLLTPPCVELRPSAVVEDGLGVWCILPISANSKFGPFAGEVILEDDKDAQVDFRYAWEVFDKETGKLMHIINATTPEVGNWMRYVNCARFYEEQNIISVQEGGEIFYEALKDIKPGEELLTWFDPLSSRKQRKRRKVMRTSSTTSSDTLKATAPPRPALTSFDQQRHHSPMEMHSGESGKRRRKKKVVHDMLSLDDDDVIFASAGAHYNKIRMGASSGLRRCTSLPDGKMMPQKKIFADSQKGVSAFLGQISTSPTVNKQMSFSEVPCKQETKNTSHVKVKKTISEIVASIEAKRLGEIKSEMVVINASESTDSANNSNLDITPLFSKKRRRSSLVGKADLNETSVYQFVFEISATHRLKGKDGGKRWKCDVCECKFFHALSFKRHYLQTHVNHKYLSQSDIEICHRKNANASVIALARDSDGSNMKIEKNRDAESELCIPAVISNKSDTVNTTADDALENPVISTDVKMEASVCSGQKKGTDREKEESDCKSLAEPNRTTFSFTGVSSVEDAFRCYMCVRLFPSLEKLQQHVKYDSHRSKGDKQYACERCNQRFRFQHNFLRHIESHGTTNVEKLSIACHICGKRFINATNMRKHLRFHSGRNFPCKYGCPDVVYPNVAELVKHLRTVHPDLPKKSTGPLEKVLSTETTPKKAKNQSKRNSEDSNSSFQDTWQQVEIMDVEQRLAWLASRPPGWVETRGRKPRPGVVGVHCTICKKKFSTYGSMCRHRNSIHRIDTSLDSSKPSTPEPIPELEMPVDLPPHVQKLARIEVGVEEEYRAIEAKMERTRKQEELETLYFSPPPSPTSFYAKVADNIATNLSSFLDGGAEALQSACKHIHIDDYVPLQERSVAERVEQYEDIDWTRFNFPPFFLPVDPVIPHPSVSSDVKLCLPLPLEVERTAAYPTRAAVASETEALRRASVGSETHLVAVTVSELEANAAAESDVKTMVSIPSDSKDLSHLVVSEANPQQHAPEPAPETMNRISEAMLPSQTVLEDTRHSYTLALEMPVVKIGTTFKNNGCDKTVQDLHSLETAISSVSEKMSSQDVTRFFEMSENGSCTSSVKKVISDLSIADFGQEDMCNKYREVPSPENCTCKRKNIKSVVSGLQKTEGADFSGDIKSLCAANVDTPMLMSKNRYIQHKFQPSESHDSFPVIQTLLEDMIHHICDRPHLAPFQMLDFVGTLDKGSDKIEHNISERETEKQGNESSKGNSPSATLKAREVEVIAQEAIACSLSSKSFSKHFIKDDQNVNNPDSTFLDSAEIECHRNGASTQLLVSCCKSSDCKCDKQDAFEEQNISRICLLEGGFSDSKSATGTSKDTVFKDRVDCQISGENVTLLKETSPVSIISATSQSRTQNAEDTHFEHGSSSSPLSEVKLATNIPLSSCNVPHSSVVPCTSNIPSSFCNMPHTSDVPPSPVVPPTAISLLNSVKSHTPEPKGSINVHLSSMASRVVRLVNEPGYLTEPCSTSDTEDEVFEKQHGSSYSTKSDCETFTSDPSYSSAVHTSDLCGEQCQCKDANLLSDTGSVLNVNHICECCEKTKIVNPSFAGHDSQNKDVFSILEFNRPEKIREAEDSFHTYCDDNLSKFDEKIEKMSLTNNDHILKTSLKSSEVLEKISLTTYYNIKSMPLASSDAMETMSPSIDTLKTTPMNISNATETFPPTSKVSLKTMSLIYNDFTTTIPLRGSDATETIALRSDDTKIRIPLISSEATEIPLKCDGTIKTVPLTSHNATETIPVISSDTIETLPLMSTTAMETASLKSIDTMDKIPLPGNVTVEKMSLTSSDIIDSMPLTRSGTEDDKVSLTSNDTLEKTSLLQISGDNLDTMPLASFDNVHRMSLANNDTLGMVSLTTKDTITQNLLTSGTVDITSLTSSDPVENISLTSSDPIENISLTSSDPVENISLTSSDPVENISLTSSDPVENISLTSSDPVENISLTSSDPVENMPLKTNDIMDIKPLTISQTVKSILLTSNDTVKSILLTSNDTVKSMPLTNSDSTEILSLSLTKKPLAGSDTVDEISCTEYDLKTSSLPQTSTDITSSDNVDEISLASSDATEILPLTYNDTFIKIPLTRSDTIDRISVTNSDTMDSVSFTSSDTEEMLLTSSDTLEVLPLTRTDSINKAPLTRSNTLNTISLSSLDPWVNVCLPQTKSDLDKMPLTNTDNVGKISSPVSDNLQKICLTSTDNTDKIYQTSIDNIDTVPQTKSEFTNKISQTCKVSDENTCLPQVSCSTLKRMMTSDNVDKMPLMANDLLKISVGIPVLNEEKKSLETDAIKSSDKTLLTDIDKEKTTQTSSDTVVQQHVTVIENMDKSDKECTCLTLDANTNNLPQTYNDILAGLHLTDCGHINAAPLSVSNNESKVSLTGTVDKVLTTSNGNVCQAALTVADSMDVNCASPEARVEEKEMLHSKHASDKLSLQNDVSYSEVDHKISCVIANSNESFDVQSQASEHFSHLKTPDCDKKTRITEIGKIESNKADAAISRTSTLPVYYKPTLSNPVFAQDAVESNSMSLKEVEYLCKGLYHYIHKDLTPCVHNASKLGTENTNTYNIPKSNVDNENKFTSEKDLDLKETHLSDIDTVLNMTKKTESVSDRQILIKTEISNSSVEDESRNKDPEIITASDIILVDCESFEQTDVKTDAVNVEDNQQKNGDSSFSNLQLQDHTSNKITTDCRGKNSSSEYYDSDSELLDLLVELELQKRKEEEAIDCDAEGACKDCLRMRQHTSWLESPAKWTCEDFEKIRFGKNGLVYSVCSMCRRYYGGVDYLLRHQWKKHPSIACSHMEVELGHNLEQLFYPEPSTHGVLAQTLLLPPEHLTLDTYTCTRCNTNFKQYNRLRAHILHCDPNTPATSHAKKKKYRNRHRHRFMEQMSHELSSSSDSKWLAKGFSLRQKDGNFSSSSKLTSSTVHDHFQQNFANNHQLYRSPGKNHCNTSQNHSQPSTPVKSKPVTGRETKSLSISGSSISCTREKISTKTKLSAFQVLQTPLRSRKRRNYELLYNPAAHVRRRETAECLEVHQCRGCGMRCKTLSLLERHARKCSGKDKLQSQRPVMNKFAEAQGQNRKHACHYCPKRFTYLKGVANHYHNNFCRARAEIITKGGLSSEDLMHETELDAAIKRQAWNKTENKDHSDVIQGRAKLHEDGTITPSKHKGGWPKGLKRTNKRRRNGWTYIKRRKTNEDSNSPVTGKNSLKSLINRDPSNSDANKDRKNCYTDKVKFQSIVKESGSISTSLSNLSSCEVSRTSSSINVEPQTSVDGKITTYVHCMSELEAKLREPVHAISNKRKESLPRKRWRLGQVSGAADLSPLDSKSVKSVDTKRKGTFPCSHLKLDQPSEKIPTVLMNKPQNVIFKPYYSDTCRSLDHTVGKNKSEKEGPSHFSQHQPCFDTHEVANDEEAPVIERMGSQLAEHLTEKDSPDLEPPTLIPMTPILEVVKSSELKQDHFTLTHVKKSVQSAMTGGKKRKKKEQLASSSASDNLQLKKPETVASKLIKLDMKQFSSSSSPKLNTISLGLLLQIPTKDNDGTISKSKDLLTSPPAASVISHMNSFPTRLVPLPPNFLYPPPPSTPPDDKRKSETDSSDFLDVFSNTAKTSPDKETPRTGGFKTKRRSKVSVKHSEHTMPGTTFATTVAPPVASVVTSALTKSSLRNVIVTNSAEAMKIQVEGNLSKCAGNSDGKLTDKTAASIISPSSKTVTTTLLAPLVSASSLAVLPPGSVVAVLPSSPILFQATTAFAAASPTTSVSTAVSSTTVSMVTNTTLQSAISAGKVLIALDPRNLRLTTGSFSLANPSAAGIPSDPQSQGLQVKTSTTKPVVTVPNFLYVNSGSVQTTSTSGITMNPALKEKEKKKKRAAENAAKKQTDKEVPPAVRKSGKERKRKSKSQQNEGLPVPANKIKSMKLMTAPGVHTKLSLDISANVEGSPSPQNKVKSMKFIATSGIQTNLSLSIPPDKGTEISAELSSPPPMKMSLLNEKLNKKTPKGVKSSFKKVKASHDTKGSHLETEGDKNSKCKEVHQTLQFEETTLTQKKGNFCTSPHSDTQSEDDLPLSQLAARVR